MYLLNCSSGGRLLLNQLHINIYIYISFLKDTFLNLKISISSSSVNNLCLQRWISIPQASLWCSEWKAALHKGSEEEGRRQIKAMALVVKRQFEMWAVVLETHVGRAPRLFSSSERRTLAIQSRTGSEQATALPTLSFFSHILCYFIQSSVRR